jgi:hypothetical protein
LCYAKWDSSLNSWNKSSPDTIGDVGRYCSIDMTNTNTVEMYYYDATNGDLKTCQTSGPGWNILPLDVTGDVGRYCSAKVGSDGSLNVSYYDSTNGNLKFGRWTAGIPWNYQNVETSGNVGLFTSLDLNSQNRPCVTFYNPASKTIKYLREYQNGSWSSDYEVAAGSYSSICIDSNDKPHIAYYDAVNGDLKYTENTSGNYGAFNTSIVDSPGNVGKYCSMKLDKNDLPYITYYDETNNVLKLARARQGVSVYDSKTGTNSNLHPSDYSWETQVIDTNPGTGTNSSLAFDSNNNLYVTYYDSVNTALKYAKLSGLDSTAGVQPNGSSLDKAYAYPVPFRPGPGSQLNFANITLDTVVEVYTYSGIRIVSFYGTTSWDGKDNNNQYMGTGTYIVSVRDRNKSSNKKVFKILVIK